VLVKELKAARKLVKVTSVQNLYNLANRPRTFFSTARPKAWGSFHGSRSLQVSSLGQGDHSTARHGGRRHFLAGCAVMAARAVASGDSDSQVRHRCVTSRRTWGAARLKLTGHQVKKLLSAAV